SAERLAQLEGAESRRAALVPRRDEAEAALARAAGKLLAARRAAAPKLATAVTERLGELALGRAECRIEVDGDGGDDGGEVVFVLAPNPGEAARPLAKAASGGELS